MLHGKDTACERKLVFSEDKDKKNTKKEMMSPGCLDDTMTQRRRLFVQELG